LIPPFNEPLAQRANATIRQAAHTARSTAFNEPLAQRANATCVGSITTLKFSCFQ